MLRKSKNWPIGILAASLILMIVPKACESPTETPTPSPLRTPTPASPLPSPTPPESPLKTPRAQVGIGIFSILFDETLHVYHTGVASPTLHVSVKLLDEGDAVVFSETQHTGLVGPDAPGTGQFDGPFNFDYPPFDGPREVWGKCEWDDAAEVYVEDADGQLQPIEAATCVYTSTQDPEGYWYFGIVEGVLYQKYLPLTLKWGGTD